MNQYLLIYVIFDILLNWSIILSHGHYVIGLDIQQNVTS